MRVSSQKQCVRDGSRANPRKQASAASTVARATAGTSSGAVSSNPTTPCQRRVLGSRPSRICPIPLPSKHASAAIGGVVATPCRPFAAVLAGRCHYYGGSHRNVSNVDRRGHIETPDKHVPAALYWEGPMTSTAWICSCVRMMRVRGAQCPGDSTRPSAKWSLGWLWSAKTSSSPRMRRPCADQAVHLWSGAI